jgi:hypothetical protein
MNIFEEEYRPVKDFENLYLVSNKGNIKSVKSNKILKPYIKNGYYGLTLSKNNIHYSKSNHVVEAEVFLIKKDEECEINHKNGNKLDNNITNLEWCTHKFNMDHASKTNLMKKGTQHGLSKLTEENIKEIRELSKTLTGVDISKKFNISPKNVSLIINRKTWKHI